MILDDEEPVSTTPAVIPTSRIVDRLADATGVLVVDASNLAWRSNFAYGDLKTSDGRPSGHVFGSFRLILAALDNHLLPGSWLLCFCYDGVDAKADRQALLPTYKGNRDPSRFNPCPDVAAALRELPGIHIEHPRREGDDALAWAAETMVANGRKVVVLSADKDTWPLLRFEGVSIFSPTYDRYVTPADIEKRFYAPWPMAVPLAKALFGDPSDGIKGVDRLFKKHVIPHIFTHGPDGLDSFLEAAISAPDAVTPPKTKLKLQENRDIIERNLCVITPDISGFDRSTVQRVAWNPEQRGRLADVFRNYESAVLMSRLQDFSGVSFPVEFEHEDS